MNFLKYIKHIFFFFLTFLLETQISYAITELVLPQNQVSFSIEKNQIFKSLEKEVQPNIGFLKEKHRFVASEGLSTHNTCDFSEYFVCELAEGVVKSADELMDFVITNGIRADIDLDYVIKFTKGRRDLCESVLLSTKDVVDGKNIQQLIQHFSIPNLPAANSLTNYQSRIWYHYKKSNITNLLDNTKSLEEQAQQAFNLRNQYRIQARDFMSDRYLADFLIANEQNWNWLDYVEYVKNKEGLIEGPALWNHIITNSQVSRDGVDKLFKLENAN